MSDENEAVTQEDREECLEALCRLEQSHRPPTVATLSTESDLAGRPLADLLVDLAVSGSVTVEGTSIRLTRKGREIGRRIIQRHQLAERVLCMLGLHPDAAHKEACHLEHILPDAASADLEKRMELIVRLVGLGAVTLVHADTRKPYRVCWIRGGQTVRKRLEDMGLVQGSTVVICNRQDGGPVEVEAHGACVALGRGVASRVLVIPEVQ
jgi:Mn-dependent DtxR family transcriptional regulator/Fe2+ transport system protein FeoA